MRSRLADYIGKKALRDLKRDRGMLASLEKGKSIAGYVMLVKCGIDQVPLEGLHQKGIFVAEYGSQVVLIFSVAFHCEEDEGLCSSICGEFRARRIHCAFSYGEVIIGGVETQLILAGEVLNGLLHSLNRPNA